MCVWICFPTEIAPETQREGRHHLSLIEGLRKEFKVSCNLRIKTERLFRTHRYVQSLMWTAKIVYKILWSSFYLHVTLMELSWEQNAALTRSSVICRENNRTNNTTMDPSPENNTAAWYPGPMKSEVVKSCVVSGIQSHKQIKGPCEPTRE